MRMVKQTTDLAEELARSLTAALQSHQRVVWLVPGGSNIPISIAAMQQIDDSLSQKLVIMQTDERYVPLDSPDCNWRQLQEGGFATKQATIYPILVDTASRDEVAVRYSEIVKREFAAADYILGQFGVGADGHIAGIKPESPASASDTLVVGYQAEDFERVTLTFPALHQLSEAITFAYGEEKRPVLEKLANDSIPLEQFPAGIIQTILTSTIYNDCITSEKGLTI